jgi:L-ribulose-5-phosphate 4-epimerase
MMRLPTLRAEVWQLHAVLVQNHLVAWTSGNVSARDPESGLIVIKPSGVAYDQLTPGNLVIVDAEGRVIEGELVPSSDTLSHCAIYRARSDVGGIAHTHSRYATAFAALGSAIPCVLTAMADEFGGAIPCGGFAHIGGEEIGHEVVRTLAQSRSPAVLLRNHGVFTIGRTAEAAVKAAVMTEDVAATVWLARQLGEPLSIAPSDIDALYHRYTHAYGQQASQSGQSGPR